jgi:hypothetical protein
MDQTIASAIDAANVIIHDNFRLINVKFMDEAIEMSALSCYETAAAGTINHHAFFI